MAVVTDEEILHSAKCVSIEAVRHYQAKFITVEKS